MTPLPRTAGPNPGTGAPVPHRTPSRGGGRGRALPPHRRQVGSPAQYITMVGRLGTTRAGFTTLCGAQPPQWTDGWAQWNIVARPRQVGITINQGYNPITMDVQLRFEAWTADYEDQINRTPNKTARLVENDLHTLVWMTGRGILYAQDGIPGNAALGDPPIISIYAADYAGQQRPLVPPDFQNMAWVISGLAWDAAPLRNADGYRVRQDVTVTLLQFVKDTFSAGTANASARQKAVVPSTSKYTVVQTTAALNTIQAIANFIGDATANQAILQANKAAQGIGSSTRKKLPPGTKIKVPSDRIKQNTDPGSMPNPTGKPLGPDTRPTGGGFA